MQFHGMEEGGTPCQKEFKEEEVLGTTDHVGMTEGAPETATPVKLFFRDLGCLQDLTLSAKPPKHNYRAKRQSAFFVIGDASSKAKGNAVVDQYGVDYELRVGSLESRIKGEVFQLLGDQESHGQIGTTGGRRGPPESQGVPHY